MVKSVGDLAVVFALLKVVLADVHFGDDSLESDKFVGHSAVESSGGDKVGAEIAFDPDVIPFSFGDGFLFEVFAFFLSFEVLFDQYKILGGVLDNLLGSFGVEGAVGIDIKGVVPVVGDGLSGQVIGEEPFILVLNVLVLDLHIGAFYKYYNLLYDSTPFKPF